MALVARGPAAPSRPGQTRRPAYVPYSRRAMPFLSMFAVHFLLAGVAAFGAVSLPSSGWAYAALAIFFSMCLGLLRFSPATFLLFVPLLATRITEFISGAAIEGGAYMIETMTTGTATGAFTRLLLIYLLFFLTATLVVEATWPRLQQRFRDAPLRWERQARLIWVGLLVVMTAGSLYLLRLGFNNGFPLFSSIDRFAYLEKLDSPTYEGLLRNRLVIVPFIGALFAVPAYRSRGALLVVWLLATSVVFGEKFGSLLMILTVFAIPFGLVYIANDRPIPIRPIVAISLAVVAITTPAVLVAYGALNNFDAAVERYGQRVALQGQLWYVTDHRYLAAGRLDDQAVAADIASWVRPGEQDATTAGTRFGLYYVMQRFTSSRMLGWTMESGNGFIGSLYPYLLIATGMIGLLIISSIIAVYHALLMRLLASSFAQANWIAGILLGRVMSSFYATYATGFLWNIFGIKTLATLAAGIFLNWEGARSTSVTRKILRAASNRVNRRAS